MKTIYMGLTLSMITASTLLANIYVPNDVFVTSLQTRAPNSSIQADGSYSFKIINPNNQECIQNTVNINKNGYNAKIYCNNNINAKPSGHVSGSVNGINYNFSLPDITFPELGTSNENFYIDNVSGFINKKLDNKIFNSIKIINWSAFTPEINGNFKQIKNMQITSNTVINSTGENDDFIAEKIGSKNQWNKNIAINFSGYNDIYIKNLTLKSNYNLNLSAKNKIVLGEINLGSGKGFLKAPEVYIQKLDTTQNLGKNINIIQADKVYIDIIDLGQLSNLIFKPYIEGMPVKVYINHIITSSSSSIKLSTGEYHIYDIVFPGQNAKVPSFVNLDKYQKTQIFVNHSIEFNNNPVINMEHVYDNIQKEPLPAKNMIWFVNGDIKIGNGGTEINALMYAEGNIFIGADAKLRGALSAKNFIHISNNHSIIYYAGGNLNVNNTNENSQNNNQASNYTLVKTPITTKIAGENYLIPIKIPNYSGIVFVAVIDGNAQCNANAKEYTNFIPVTIDNGIGYFPLNIDIPIKNAKLLITFPNESNSHVQNCIAQSFKKHHHYCKIHFYHHSQISKSDFNTVSDMCFEMSKEINQCLIESNHKHGCHFQFSFQGSINQPIKVNADFQVANSQIKTIGKTCACKHHFHFGFKFLHYHKNITTNSLDNTQSIISNAQFLCSDNFAIRPAKFIILPIKNKIKAGNDFTIEIEAVDANGNVIPLNNYSIGNNNIDNAHLNYNDTNSKAIPGILHYNSSVFSNGIAKINASYNEVGQLNLKVQEQLNREFAQVDKDDTSAAQRLIPSNSQIVDFIPYGFKIFYTNKPLNKKADISYVGATDLENMNNIAITINAVNKQGEIVKNYTKDLYAKNGKIDFSISSSKPIFTKVLINYNNDLLSAPANNKKNWNIELNNVSKNIFNNGVANINIGYSFSKDYENPMPPFTTKISNVKFSDTDNVTTLSSTQTSNSVSAIKNIYERIEFNNVTSMKNNADIIATYQYWNGNNWVVNTNHNTNDGEINIAKTQLANPNFEITRKQAPVNGKEIINVKVKNNVVLPYNGEIHIAIPSYEWYHPLAKDYLDPSTNNTDCTTHPCVNVQFIGKSQTWTGIQSKKIQNTFKNKTIDVNASRTTGDIYDTSTINW